MARQLHTEPGFAEVFIAHMLRRNIRVEEDLVDVRPPDADLLGIMSKSDEETVVRDKNIKSHSGDYELKRGNFKAKRVDLCSD